MTINESREILGTSFDDLPDSTLENLLLLIESVCSYIIATDIEEDNSDHITYENHDL